MTDAGRKKAAATAFSAVLFRASGLEKQALTRWDDWFSAGTPEYKQQLMAENRAAYRQQQAKKRQANIPAQTEAAARAAQGSNWWSQLAPYMKYIIPGALGGLMLGDDKTPWYKKLLGGALMGGLGGYGYERWGKPAYDEYMAQQQAAPAKPAQQQQRAQAAPRSEKAAQEK